MARISESLRDFVADRANSCCEYCLLDSKYSFFSFHIEHIVSLKHEVQTNPDNLVLACFVCNFNKGSDIATRLLPQPELIRFFSPQTDTRTNHFKLEKSGLIIAKTNVGEVTIKIFKHNHRDTLIQSKELLQKGLIKL
jgi:5-methylcytosine-specific restriction endonuclease McrA